MHVGFVGTGNMGRPMAENVLKAGHALTVYDTRPEATRPLETLGARRAPDLPTLAGEVRGVLLSLPDETVVSAVVLGAGGSPGLLEGARPGDVIFDLSTVSPAGWRRGRPSAACG
jgi:2-hydroxy-3-oxopropionate reductase